MVSHHLCFSVLLCEKTQDPPFMGFWDEMLQGRMKNFGSSQGSPASLLPVRHAWETLNWRHAGGHPDEIPTPTQLALSLDLSSPERSHLISAIHVYDPTLPVKAHDYRRVLSSKSKVWPPAQFLLHLKYQVKCLHSCWHCNKLPVDLTLHFTFTQDPEILRFPHLNQQFTPNANRAI